MNEFTFKGKWDSCYTHDGDKQTKHTVCFQQQLEGVKGESLPQKDQTHLTLSLNYDSDNNIITGTWQEVSSVAGPHNGQIFHGALQLIPNTAGTKAEGEWVGYNKNRTKINSGKWVLKKGK